MTVTEIYNIVGIQIQSTKLLRILELNNEKYPSEKNLDFQRIIGNY